MKIARQISADAPNAPECILYSKKLFLQAIYLDDNHKTRLNVEEKKARRIDGMSGPMGRPGSGGPRGPPGMMDRRGMMGRGGANRNVFRERGRGTRSFGPPR